MRILLIIDSLGSGGAQRQIVNLATGLKGLGHKVDIFTYRPEICFYKSLLIEQDIKLVEYRKRFKVSLGLLLRMKSLIMRNRYETIISFLDMPNLYAEVCSIGCNRIPFIVSERSSFTGSRVSLFASLLRQMHRLANAVTVNSFYQKNKLEQLFPWLKKKLVVIYNGIDLNLFKPSSEFSANGITKLVAVGSVSKVKNPLGLAQALKIYIDMYGNDISIDWVGRIDRPGNNEAFKQVSQFLKDNNLGPYWRWIGEIGRVDALLPSYNALVHPSYTEGLSNAICEALACGLPVLAGNTGDNPILIGNNERGIIFDQKRPESMAVAMRQFIELPMERKKQLKKDAREFAEKFLSISKYCNSYVQLIKAIKRGELPKSLYDDN